jgi:hypothetical protein
LTSSTLNGVNGITTATAHVLRFEDRAALSQYNALMADIKQAGAAEASASKRLAALMTSSGRVSPL